MGLWNTGEGRKRLPASWRPSCSHISMFLRAKDPLKFSGTMNQKDRVFTGSAAPFLSTESDFLNYWVVSPAPRQCLQTDAQTPTSREGHLGSQGTSQSSETSTLKRCPLDRASLSEKLHFHWLWPKKETQSRLPLAVSVLLKSHQSCSLEK